MRMLHGRPPRRALIVNGYFPEARQRVRESRTVLRTMAPPFLAGWLDPRHWSIRLHDEHTGGPLRTPEEVGDNDLVILTGMTSGLDRMLHLAALAKTANPRCVTVAGGAAVRAVPRFAADRFDYACLGGVEEIADVVADAFGPSAAAAEWTPRFDLAPWASGAMYVESSRSCNFHCSFCSLTAEGRPYQRYGLEAFHRQVDAQPRRRILVMIDNNFFGSDRQAFEERIALLAELRARGRFSAWGALVTADFFEDAARVERAVAAGCRALFCGIESFDPRTLAAYHKRQNLRTQPIDVLRTALGAGILPVYGLVLDVINRTVEDLTTEVAAIAERRDGVLPSFVGTAIPYPSTPFFRECAAAGRLLPQLRLRDLNGSTLCVRPRDDLERVAAFLRAVGSLDGFRWQGLRTTASAWFRGELGPSQLAVMTARNLAVLARRSRGTASRRRTFVGPTEALDDLYRPRCRIAPAYRKYFAPTFVTDAEGMPSSLFADETRHERATAP